MTDNRQVIIYFNDPTGQLLQVSYQEYKSYWRLIGWQLQGQAAQLPGIIDKASTRAQGLQASLL